MAYLLTYQLVLVLADGRRVPATLPAYSGGEAIRMALRQPGVESAYIPGR